MKFGLEDNDFLLSFTSFGDPDYAVCLLIGAY